MMTTMVTMHRNGKLRIYQSRVKVEGAKNAHLLGGHCSFLVSFLRLLLTTLFSSPTLAVIHPCRPRGRVSRKEYVTTSAVVEHMHTADLHMIEEWPVIDTVARIHRAHCP